MSVTSKSVLLQILSILILFCFFQFTIQQQQPCIPFGNRCFSEQDWETCNTNLGLLSQNGDSVDNSCIPKPFIVENKIQFSVQTRQLLTPQQGTGIEFASNLKQAFEAAPQPSGYCNMEEPTFPLSNIWNCGAADNIVWRYDFEFTDSEAAVYEFEFGVQFSLGAAIFVDGIVQYSNPNALSWTTGNWGHPDVIKISFNLAPGPHRILVFGHEGCCDAPAIARFKRNGSPKYLLSKQNAEVLIPHMQDRVITSYNFQINYNAPYSFNSNCLTQEITFENLVFPPGNEYFNQWQFNSLTQTIDFNVKHEDLETFGCAKIVSPEQYEWQCEMALHVYFAGVEQYTYSFHMIVKLKRDNSNSLTVKVQKNEVVGDCCENKLGVETTLKFCSDFSCQNYLSAPLTVQRKQDIFIEHSIVSSQFQQFYMHGLQVKIGPFLPEIINWNGSQKGRIIYHLQSNIAAEALLIEAISRIDENPARRRRLLLGGNRALQSYGKSELGPDYKVKAQQTIKIEEEDEQQALLKRNKKNQQKLMIVLIASFVGLICVTSFAALFVFKCYEKKKINLKNCSSINKVTQNNRIKVISNILSSATAQLQNIDEVNEDNELDIQCNKNRERKSTQPINIIIITVRFCDSRKTNSYCY